MPIMNSLLRYFLRPSIKASFPYVFLSILSSDTLLYIPSLKARDQLD